MRDFLDALKFESKNYARVSRNSVGTARRLPDTFTGSLGILDVRSDDGNESGAFVKTRDDESCGWKPGNAPNRRTSKVGHTP